MTLIAGSSVRSVDFGGLQIAYDDRVLEPRAWTQWQSAWAAELSRFAPVGPLLEMCSGAGQIGLLAIKHCDRDLVAVDLNEAACRFAAANASSAGLGERVEVRNVRFETACAPGEVFPIIVADPPWVPTGQTHRFPGDPLGAIDGGEDGLDVARACLDVIGAHLHPDGFALLQIGDVDQAKVLAAQFSRTLDLLEVREEHGRGAVALMARMAYVGPVEEPAAG